MKNIFFFFLSLAIFAALLWLVHADPVHQEDPDTWQTQNCVCVLTDHGYGSGVIFKNRGRTFVWTAAHVLADSRRIETVIDLGKGTSKTKVYFGNVLVKQPLFQNGVKVGDNFRLARVLRYGDFQQGKEDLGLLEILDARFGGKGVIFTRSAPTIGQSVWHVGSMGGTAGECSVVKGMISALGRLRSEGRPDQRFGLTYDQISLPLQGGSSGGGVFDQESGTCLGLVSEKLIHQTECLNCLIPTRVMLAYARRTDCLWAMDSTLVVPENSDELEEKEIVCPPSPKMPPAKDD